MPAGGHRGAATGRRWQEPKRGVNSNTSAQTCLKASRENLHITFFYIIMYADSCIRYRLSVKEAARRPDGFRLSGRRVFISGSDIVLTAEQ